MESDSGIWDSLKLLVEYTILILISVTDFFFQI